MKSVGYCKKIGCGFSLGISYSSSVAEEPAHFDHTTRISMRKAVDLNEGAYFWQAGRWEFV
jgi:hypothetical protein